MVSQTGKIVSIQVGKIQRHVMPENVRVDYRHPFWTSAIFKDKVEGAVQVGEVVEGDQQTDLENHGGPDNVVLAYNVAHYAVWKEKLGMPEIGNGMFGENFTVEGFSDHDVCVGDVWEIGAEGGLKMQVTQARQPCFKLARRLRQAHIVKYVHETGWGGWYLRVLRAGKAEAGMEIRLVERTRPEWTVAKAVQVMYGRKRESEKARELAAVPELSARWKRELVEE